MADVVTPDVRSKMMSGIRPKDTKPEVMIRRELHARGLRFRLHDKRLPGTPDIVFPKHHAAIEVQGCFWHAHRGCRFFKVPESRRDFWTRKLEANRTRDARNHTALGQMGWRVAIVWECATRTADATLFDRLADWVRGQDADLEVPADDAVDARDVL